MSRVRAFWRELDWLGRLALFAGVGAIVLAFRWPVLGALVLPPIIQLLAVAVLLHAYRQRERRVISLLDRLLTAAAGFLMSIGFVVLSLNAFLGRPWFNLQPPNSTIVVATLLLINSAPTGYFLWLWASKQFGEREQ